jgi:hypothetical protein
MASGDLGWAGEVGGAGEHFGQPNPELVLIGLQPGKFDQQRVSVS